MIQLNDPALKRALIEKHHFQEHFSLDLEKCSVLLRCEAGETLCHSGEIYPEIQLLADGALIASSVSKSGKLHCELQYQSPNILGLTSALWNKPAINTIEALTPCLCLSLSVDLYGEALHQDTKFLNYACSYLAEHIRKNFIHYEQLPTRLAQFILRAETSRQRCQKVRAQNRVRPYCQTRSQRTAPKRCRRSCHKRQPPKNGFDNAAKPVLKKRCLAF